MSRQLQLRHLVGQRIANLLDGVSSSDRDEIVKIVESICALSHKKHKKTMAL
jgi:hypothetical protein